MLNRLKLLLITTLMFFVITGASIFYLFGCGSPEEDCCEMCCDDLNCPPGCDCECDTTSSSSSGCSSKEECECYCNCY